MPDIGMCFSASGTRKLYPVFTTLSSHFSCSTMEELSPFVVRYATTSDLFCY